MICNNCGYSNLDVHRTRDRIITYCQNCSDNKTATIEHNEAPIADFAEAKQRKQRQKITNCLSPAARKRLRVSG